MDELDTPFYLQDMQRSFLYRAAKLWDGLDNIINDSSSNGVRKNLIRNIILYFRILAIVSLII